MLVRYAPSMLLGIAILAGLVPFFVRRYSEWESVYIPAAQRLVNGQPLYQDGDPYLYPPFVAGLALPWTVMPAWLGRLAWFVVCAGSVWAVVRLGWKLTGEHPHNRDWWTWLIGLGCGGLYLQNSWAHQQTDVLLAGMQILALWLLVKQRDASAGTLFGLAAAIKCTPLLWLPFLIWRGRFGAAVVLVGVGLGASLLPDLWVRAPSGTWLGQYAQRVLAPDRPMGIWGTDPIYNQSLAGTSLRWLAVEAIAQPNGGVQSRFHAEKLDAGLHRRGLMAVAVLLLLATLFCAGRPGTVPPEALAWEGATVLLLALLLSPMSGPAHFGTQILAGFLLARSGGWGRVIALSVALLSLLSAKDLVRSTVYDYALFYGHITLGTLLLLVGCWYGRWSVHAVSPVVQSVPELVAQAA